MSERAHRMLARLAERADDDAAYLGSLLDRYAESQALSASQLAGALGISEDTLLHLRLCRRPREKHFVADTVAIAAHVLLDSNVLVAIIRQAAALEAMLASSRGSGQEHGFLLAARTRHEDEMPHRASNASDESPDDDGSDGGRRVGDGGHRDGQGEEGE